VLSIPHVRCHSDFSCDFKFCIDYVFADDFWLGATRFTGNSMRQWWLCFSIDFMRQSWISGRCWFHQSAATQFSKIISRCIVTQFSVMISGWAFAECVSHFQLLAMNLFFLSICCVGRAFDSTCQLSLRFQLWFQGLQRLCFRWRFMVRSDVVSLAIPCVNDDSVFLLISWVNRELVVVVYSINQPRLNFQRWFLVL